MVAAQAEQEQLYDPFKNQLLKQEQDPDDPDNPDADSKKVDS